MRGPDFYIVGAPKSGTTSLNDFLAVQPGVFMGPKELHFHGDEWNRWSEAQYLAFFAPASEDQLVGEASVRYFASRSAAKSIHEFNADARIIVMLRRPAETIVSMHQDLVFLGLEPLQDLRDALADEDQRRLATPAGWSNPLLYLDQVRYADHLRRYFDLFGRDRVQVVLLDDVRADAAGTFGAVLRFLSLPPSAVQPVHRNAAKVVRSRTVRDFVVNRPRWAGRAARALLPDRWRIAMWRRVMLLNSRSKRSTVDEELMRSLASSLSGEVEALSELLERDLSSWRDAPRTVLANQ